MSVAGQKERERLFVVGVGRSGTSLLQSMLGAHTDICFAPETGFFRQCFVKNVLPSITRNRDTPIVLETLLKSDKIKRLSLPEEDVRAIIERDSIGSSATIYDRLLTSYADRQDECRIIGDKDPRLVEFLPTVHRHYPRAFVLHIIRDPRDVLASKKKAAWSRNRSPLRHVLSNRVQIALGHQYGPRLFGRRYLELHYEQLITQPSRVLANICEFLQIPFESGMLEFSNSSKRLVAPDELEWKKETLGPLLAQNQGKWRGVLTPVEAELTELLCRQVMELGGYLPAAPQRQVGFVRRICDLYPKAIAIALASWFYRGYRTWEQR